MAIIQQSDLQEIIDDSINGSFRKIFCFQFLSQVENQDLFEKLEGVVRGKLGLSQPERIKKESTQ